jgi:predicted Zn-dependent protease
MTGFGVTCIIIVGKRRIKIRPTALPQLQKAVSRAPDHGHSRRYLAATYAQLGQLGRAREEAAEALRIEPWFTISQGIFARICKRPEDAEHFSDGLRKAGFPE